MAKDLAVWLRSKRSTKANKIEGLIRNKNETFLDLTSATVEDTDSNSSQEDVNSAQQDVETFEEI